MLRRRDAEHEALRRALEDSDYEDDDVQDEYDPPQADAAVQADGLGRTRCRRCCASSTRRLDSWVSRWQELECGDKAVKCERYGYASVS